METIEIIKQKDDFVYSTGISQNSKGEAQLEVKVRFDKIPDEDGEIKKQFDKILKELKDSCITAGIKVAGT